MNQSFNTGAIGYSNQELFSQRGAGLVRDVSAARMVAFGEYAEDGTASTVKSRDYKDTTDPVAKCSTGDVAHCLNAGGMGRQDYETETLVTHALRGEGFDASEDGTGRGTPLVPVQDFYSTESRCDNFPPPNVSPPLKVGSNGGGQPPAIAFSAKDHGADASEDLSPTLRAMSHNASHANGGGQLAVAFAQNTWDEIRLLGGDGQIAGALAAEPGMQQTTYVAIPLQEIGKRTGVSTDDPRAGVGIGEAGDPMFTLQAGAQHGVAYTLDLRNAGRDAKKRDAVNRQRRYFVPCPHCGTMQWLQFERLRWEKGKPEIAHYLCEACEGQISESSKTEMLARGEWRPTASPGAGLKADPVATVHAQIVSAIPEATAWRTLLPPWGRAAVRAHRKVTARDSPCRHRQADGSSN